MLRGPRTMRSAATVCGALLLLGALAWADLKPPTVNVYTQTPLEFGERNTLICHCSGFHPPRLEMQLLRNGEDIASCKQTDLSFGRDWTYYLSKFVEIHPKEGETYECRVSHNEGEAKTYKLETF